MPGLAMQALSRMSVRSFLLTSGTMSPLSSFAAELRLQFPIQLENPHVIDPSQVSMNLSSLQRSHNLVSVDRSSISVAGHDMGPAESSLHLTLYSRPSCNQYTYRSRKAHAYTCFPFFDTTCGSATEQE